MLLTYEYRIKPSPEQVAIMDNWLELLRRHWNYALGERLDWLSRSRSWVNQCSIVSEPIGDVCVRHRQREGRLDLPLSGLVARGMPPPPHRETGIHGHSDRI